MAPKNITVIGSLNVDLVSTTARVPSAGETLTGTSFSIHPGGKGANQAVASSRLSRSSLSPATSDVNVSMIGSLGLNDPFSPLLLTSLQSSKVNTSSIPQVPSLNTGTAIILVEESTGENRILLNPGANHHLLPSDFLTPESLGTPKPDLIILQLEIRLDTVLQIISTAKSSNIPILLNPAPAVQLSEDVYQGLDHLIVNETEAALLTSTPLPEIEIEDFDWLKILSNFKSRGVKNVVVTLGAKGAYWANEDGEGFVPAVKVEKVVDTTAAGDTFIGAYAVGILRGGKVEDVVKGACKASARTVEVAGAQSSIPWENEV